MIPLRFKVLLIFFFLFIKINFQLNIFVLIQGDPIKNDDEIDTILTSLKNDLLDGENEEITFSDEESETSPKKTMAFENNSISTIKTTPGMLIK